MASFIVAALEGDFLDHLPEIARACRRRPVGEVQYFADWPSAAPLARRPNSLSAAISGAWTVLGDDSELTDYLFGHPKVCAALASRYRTRVVSAFAQSVSACCGYRVHTPRSVRSVAVLQNEVLEDLGDPLPGEDTDDLERHGMYSVLAVLGLIGLDVADGVEASVRCAVLQLAPQQRPSAKRDGDSDPKRPRDKK
jgi:hypothetical protein